MTKVRDWQEDMELGHTARYEYKIEHLNPVLDALFYWLQQYAEASNEVCFWKGEAAEEKERADTLLGANQMYQVELAESLGREKKLREAIEGLINDGLLMIPEGEDRAVSFLASLYPEEGEAK